MCIPMNAYVLSPLFALFFAVNISAQSVYHSQGQVNGSTGLPLKDAIVTFISATDHSVLYVQISDVKGAFALPSVLPQDSMLVEVVCSGYEKQRRTYKFGDALVFQLDADSVAHTLGTAEVSVSHSSFRKENGKFVFRPHGVDLMLPNAAEVLRYVPLLTVGANGGVSVLGKGQSTIYVNGQKPLEGGEMLMNRLRSLRPLDILRVEIIRSPGSKYSASTQGAIVNVVLRDPQDGVLGVVNDQMDYSTNRLSTKLSASLSSNRNRFSQRVSALWYDMNVQSDADNSYDYKDVTKMLESDHTGNSKSFGGYILWNGDYRLEKGQKLGVAAYVTTARNEDKVTDLTHMYEESVHVAARSRTLNENATPWSKPNYGGMLSYTLKRQKLKVSAHLEASDYQSVARERMKYQRWNESEQSFASYEDFKQDVDGMNRYVSADALVVYKAKEGNSLTFNYQGQYVKTVSELKRWNRDLLSLQEVWLPDVNVSNRFVTTEWMQALNVSYGHDWCETVNTEIGIRGEYRHNTYDLITGNSRIHRNDIDWFPSVIINWDISEDHNISLSYSRNLQAPFRSALNPFVRQISENVYAKGNPFLKNSTKELLGLEYSLFSNWTFLFDYQFCRKEILDYEWTDGTGKTYQSTFNNGHSHYFTWSLEFDKWFFRERYHLSASAELSYNRSFGQVTDTSRNNYHVFSPEISVSNRIILSRENGMQCGVSYLYSGAVRSVTKKISGSHFFDASFIKQFRRGASLQALIQYRAPRRVTSLNTSDYAYRFAERASRLYGSLTLTIPLGHLQTKTPEWQMPDGAKRKY